MEAADAHFCLGLEYLTAARRLDGLTELPALQRLAREYRERGNALLIREEGSDQRRRTPPLRTLHGGGNP